MSHDALGIFAANRPRRTSVALLVLALALVMPGCARGRIIKPGKLPAEYLVGPTQNAQTVDLSKLAGSSASSELIDRGDVLEVSIESGYEREHASSALPVRVGEDGAAQIPLVGSVTVAGVELTGAEQAIRAAAIERGVYRNPNVTVVMKQQRVNKVTIVGAVNEPGTYELPRANSALLGALVAAKGLSEDAGTQIEIRRPALRSDAVPGDSGGDRVAGDQHQLASYAQPATLRPASSYRVDLVAATKEVPGTTSYYLDDGDVVMVEKKDPQPVHVIGLVSKPGEIKLPANRDLHVLDAIALAGGQSTPYIDKIHVIRHVAGSQEPLVIKISLREAKATGKGNLLLGAGDIVSLEQTPFNFAMDVVKTVIPYTVGPALNASLLR